MWTRYYFVIKGNFLCARDDPSHYLGGIDFGKVAGRSETMIIFPTRDGQRGGDFEMWFCLTRDGPWISAPGVEGKALIDDAFCESPEGCSHPKEEKTHAKDQGPRDLE